MEKKHRDIVIKYMEYFTETTGKSVDDFFAELSGSPSWLTSNIVSTLSNKGITKDNLFEYKDLIHRYDKRVSKTEGEFYTPAIWCIEAHKYIKDLCGSDWGKVNIWDASCGTGNLLAEIDYPHDKLFCSTLNGEDIDIVKTRLPDVESFKLDFLNERDYDDMNEFFSENLPDSLRTKLRNNEPFLFFMNPPYSGNTQSEVAEIMRQENLPNASEAFCQFYHRIDMLCDYYNLTNVYIAFFHPLSKYKYLFNKTSQYKFERGFCFDRKEFKGTANFDTTWYVGLYLWKSTEAPIKMDSFPFTRKENQNGTIVDCEEIFVGNDTDYKKSLRGSSSVGYMFLPECNGNAIDTSKSVKVKKNSIGFFSNPFIDKASAMTSSWFDTVPYCDNYSITPDVFFKFVPFALLNGMRSSGAIQNCNFTIHSPEEGPGYKDWLIDNIPLFLFSRHARFRSVRGIEYGGSKIDIANSMFPAKKTDVQQIISDETILEDINNSEAKNDFIVQLIKSNYNSFSAPARDFFDFCMVNVLDSLTENKRKNDNYVAGTQCWDAGIFQVRKLPTFWTPDKEKKYFELQNDLVSSLSDGVYDFGLVDKGWKKEGGN